MPWFAEYVTATGALHAHGDLDPVPPAGPGRTVKTFGSTQAGKIWNAATLEYDPKPKEIRLPPHEFLLLFTRAERLAIDTSVDNAVRDSLWLMRFMGGRTLDANQGLTILDQLEAAGIINAARKAAIIAAARN